MNFPVTYSDNNSKISFDASTVGTNYVALLSFSLSSIPGKEPTFTITIDDFPISITEPGYSYAYKQFGFVLLVHCIHGDSLIETKDGLVRIKDIKKGDLVLTGKNLDEYKPVVGLHQCWITTPGPEHDAIIFNDTGLIIDPNHMMCTKEEYLEFGMEALKPAGFHYKNGEPGVECKKWIDVVPLSKRFDIDLGEHTVYIANGMVVNSAYPGKDHRYEDLI